MDEKKAAVAPKRSHKAKQKAKPPVQLIEMDGSKFIEAMSKVILNRVENALAAKTPQPPALNPVGAGCCTVAVNKQLNDAPKPERLPNISEQMGVIDSLTCGIVRLAENIAGRLVSSEAPSYGLNPPPSGVYGNLAEQITRLQYVEKVLSGHIDRLF